MPIIPPPIPPMPIIPPPMPIMHPLCAAAHAHHAGRSCPSCRHPFRRPCPSFLRRPASAHRHHLSAHHATAAEARTGRAVPTPSGDCLSPTRYGSHRRWRWSPPLGCSMQRPAAPTAPAAPRCTLRASGSRRTAAPRRTGCSATRDSGNPSSTRDSGNSQRRDAGHSSHASHAHPCIWPPSSGHPCPPCHAHHAWPPMPIMPRPCHHATPPIAHHATAAHAHHDRRPSPSPPYATAHHAAAHGSSFMPGCMPPIWPMPPICCCMICHAIRPQLAKHSAPRQIVSPTTSLPKDSHEISPLAGRNSSLPDKNRTSPPSGGWLTRVDSVAQGKHRTNAEIAALLAVDRKYSANSGAQPKSLPRVKWRARGRNGKGPVPFAEPARIGVRSVRGTRYSWSIPRKRFVVPAPPRCLPHRRTAVYCGPGTRRRCNSPGLRGRDCKPAPTGRSY